MTDENRPDIDEATEQAAESKRQSEREWREARAASTRHRSLASVLRALREANGFDRLFDEAFGGGRG